MAIDINIPSQVKNYANLAAFPATGSLKTIFIAEDTNKTYRWTGSAYVEISASQATAWGAITGTLSSQTDLNTALSGKVPTTRTLTINGTTQDLSADRTFTISTGITIGTTAITSGTVGRVLFEGTGNVVQESANLFWDNTNGRLGIGTSSPSAIIHSVGSVTASGAIGRGNYLNNTLVASANSDVLVGLDVQPTFTNGAFTGVANFAIRASTTSTSAIGKLLIGTTSNPYSVGSLVVEHPVSFVSWFKRGANMIEINPSSSGVNIITSTVDTGGTQLPLSLSARKINADLYLQTTGNIGIGTTTDAGFKLDVNGTARVSGLLTLSNGITMTTSGSPANILVTGYTCVFRLTATSGVGNFDFAKYNGYAQISSINESIRYSSPSHLFGGTTVNYSALINMESTTQGFLPPRMTTTQKNAIATPATGLMVYDTTLNLISVYNGTIWISL